MKKLIITTLALVMGVTFFAGTAFAETTLNSPGSMATMTVGNDTTNPCSLGPVDGCWKSSTTAKPGDIIAAQIYFKNTGSGTAEDVKVAIHPSRSGANVTFNGVVVSSTAERVYGTATVTLSQDTTITNMPQNGPYQASWNLNSGGGSRPVNTDQLFGTGFTIGNLAPGEQGVLVVRFKVNGDSTPVQTCNINSFSANPSTITSGNSSSLNWNTSNCDYVNITALGTTVGDHLQATDSKPVTPNSTRTYTLTAYPGGKTATTTITVNNGGGGNNNSCVINNFTANPSSINYGSSSQLNWNTTNCDYVNIATTSGILDGGTRLNVDDSKTVYPSNTTSYTLNAFPGGATSTVTVYVGNNNGGGNSCYINSFYADSNSITQGQTTTLRWNVTGASSVYISGLGTQYGNSISISPYYTTTYTISPSGYNCSGGSQSVTVTVGQPNNGTYAQPQAITTVGTPLSSYSAQLNGIAVPNSNYGSSTAWFEWGSTTSLGNRTDAQNVNGQGSNPYSAGISGLSGGRTYYFRAAVQNQYGTAYGTVVPFTTPAATTTYVPPTRVVYVGSQTTTRTNTGLVANSQPSLFKLQVDSSFDHMCVGGDVDYTVTYQNISTQTLENSILRITFPGELTYASASRGDYSVTDRTLTIALGNVQPGEQGSVTVHAQVNNTAVAGKLAVITATIVYTNPTTHAQENAIAYSLITVSNDCPNVLGASVFGFGGFLPTTLLGWLLLILIILALIVLARMLYRKNEPQKTA